MTTNFDSIQTLKSSDVCGKFSKSVSYETLVGGTATIGREYKQTRRVFLSSADKPLSAVGTLTSLLCNSAKVVEKLLHRHPERSEGSTSLSSRRSVALKAIFHACLRAVLWFYNKHLFWGGRLPRRTFVLLAKTMSGASCREAHKRRFLNSKWIERWFFSYIA